MDVYNLLPSDIVGEESVPEFQKRLQNELTEVAAKGMHGWQKHYSPKLPMYAHPLRTIARGANGAATNLATTDAMDGSQCISCWLRFGQ